MRSGQFMDIINDISLPAKMNKKALFFVLIAAATVIPIMFVVLATPFRGQRASIDSVFSLLLLMSTMHVGLTAFFYTDSDYRNVVKEKWQFYIGLPLIVILAMGLISSAFPTQGIIYIMMFYHAWLLFHYGRQNYGVLSFVSV